MPGYIKVTTPLLFCFILLTGCNKSNNDNNTNTTGTTSNSNPFVEYIISGNKIRVDCSNLLFEAQNGDINTGVLAISQSTKASFSFSFPAFYGDFEKLSTGNYPIKEYAGYAYDTIPFHFSLKAPKTSGGTDYYLSLEPTNTTFKNQISAIEKGTVENGKQVYWVTGQFNLAAKNVANSIITIAGNYKFKLLTLQVATVVLPTVITLAVSDTTPTSAKVSGNVTSAGNTSITARGFCWNTITNPTISDNISSNGTGLGTFSASMIGLDPSTLYFVRSYATNSKGTAYGNELQLTTKSNIPTIVSTALTRNTPYYAEVTAEVINDANSGISEAGICWSKTINPTITNSRTTDPQPGNGTFTGRIIALSPHTTYYARAFAYNNIGSIAYGTQISFTTPDFTYGGAIDQDGNVYKTIVIGTQTWMVENLKTAHYRNGDAIPQVTSNTTWTNLTTGAYCYYNNNPTYNDTFGKLYNFSTVLDSRGLAPLGWHIPKHTDINILYTFLTGGTVRPYSMQEAGTSHWLAPNAYATNETGFTGLPGGERSSGFTGKGQIGKFWLNEIFALGNADFISLHSSIDDISGDVDFWYAGLSVRCVKD